MDTVATEERQISPLAAARYAGQAPGIPARLHDPRVTGVHVSPSRNNPEIPLPPHESLRTSSHRTHLRDLPIPVTVPSGVHQSHLHQVEPQSGVHQSHLHQVEPQLPARCHHEQQPPLPARSHHTHSQRVGEPPLPVAPGSHTEQQPPLLPRSPVEALPQRPHRTHHANNMQNINNNTIFQQVDLPVGTPVRPTRLHNVNVEVPPPHPSSIASRTLPPRGHHMELPSLVGSDNLGQDLVLLSNSNNFVRLSPTSPQSQQDVTTYNSGSRTSSPRSPITLGQVRQGPRARNEYVDAPHLLQVRSTNVNNSTVNGEHVVPRQTDVIFSQPQPSGLKKENSSSGDEEHPNVPCKESLYCSQCGLCRCHACTQPRELPKKWLCDKKCECSLQKVVDVVSCLCCIRGVFYHAFKDSEADNEPCASDDPCACCEQPHCCKRWTSMATLLPCLPCLCLYWPLRCGLSMCTTCYNRCSRRGCHCRRDRLPGSKRLLIDSESSSA